MTPEAQNSPDSNPDSNPEASWSQKAQGYFQDPNIIESAERLANPERDQNYQAWLSEQLDEDGSSVGEEDEEPAIDSSED